MKLAAKFSVAVFFSTYLVACASPNPDPDAGYPVSGAITVDAGQKIDVGAVTLTLVGGPLVTPLSVQSGADGGYTFPWVQNGAYKLSPTKIGLKFTPPVRDVVVKSAAMPGQDFVAAAETAATYVVSGTITAPSGNLPLRADVSLTLTDTKSGAIYSAKSDSVGKYAFPPVIAGSYTLKPFKNGVAFTPTDQSITVSTAAVTAQDFAAVEGTYTVSGTITTQTNQNVDKVTLTMTGGNPSVSQNTLSAADGGYTFSTKVKNGDYNIIASKDGLVFNPSSVTVQVNGKDQTAPNMVASAAPKNTAMSCDVTETWCRPNAAGIAQALNKPIYRIWATSGTDIWFVGGTGTILRYISTAGQPPAWKQENAGATEALYAIWGRNSSEVWVSGAAKTNRTGTNIYQFDAGSTPQWTSFSTDPAFSKDINVIWGNSDSPKVLYGMCNETTGWFPNLGETWYYTYNTIQNEHVYGAWSATSSDQWIVGRTMQAGGGTSGPTGNPNIGVSGRMWRQQDGGSWVQAYSANFWTRDLLNATATQGAWFGDIRGTNASDIWAVGMKGLIAHFDGGVWDVVDAGVGSTNLYGVWPVSANEVWFAGGNPANNTGKLYKVTDAGGTWISQDITTIPGDAGVLFRVYVDSASNFVWLGSATGILRYKY